MGGAGQSRGGALPGLLLRLPRPRGAGRLRADAARGLPRLRPGSFTWDEDLSGWVWTTFNEWQWDVNWSNPEVLLEYADIVLFLANLGVEVLRLDAIAFTWKRLGTNCQNQPEVHSLTQVLRRWRGSPVRQRFSRPRPSSARATWSSTSVWRPCWPCQRPRVPQQPHGAGVVDAGCGQRRPGTAGAGLAAADPATGTWVCYVRCHDDIGWAIDDDDARAVGLDGFAHRRFLSDWYAGEFPGSWARGLVFQHNPVTGDRRSAARQPR